MKDYALIIVDMLYDFIDGSMACRNAKEAVNETVAFIEFPILFICDHHPADHCSFKENGGIWPAHCVAGTRGSAVHDRLTPYVSEELTFYKGCDSSREQYSGWEGVNKAGQSVEEILDLMDINDVYVCGIATEYCVRSTAEDMLKAGKNVTVIEKALAYVDHEGHLKALEEMRSEGMEII